MTDKILMGHADKERMREQMITLNRQFQILHEALHGSSQIDKLRQLSRLEFEIKTLRLLLEAYQ